MSITIPEIGRENAVDSRAGAWHQSGLATLLDGCSWQFFLGNVLKLPQAPKPAACIGTAFHAALEKHELARLAGIPEGLSLDELYEIGERELLAKIDDYSLVASVHAALKNWYSGLLKDGSPSQRDWLLGFDVVAVEPYFRLPLVTGALPIGGWIDVIYKTREEVPTYFLVDHKTAGNFGRWADGSHHRTQATMYSTAIAISPDYPGITTLLPMVFMVTRIAKGKAKTFEPARRITVQPDSSDVAELGNRIRSAEQIVATEDYTRKPEWNLCSKTWCPFFEGCMTGAQPLAGTPASVRLRLGITKN